MVGRTRLVVGAIGASCGMVIVLSGVAVVAYQIARWIDTGHWDGFPLLSLVEHPLVSRNLPEAFTQWLWRPQPTEGLHAFAIFVLETVPSSLFLLGTGLLALWKVTRWH